MINIVYERQLCQVTVYGHAGYAEPGHDIVCAGISALYGTLCLLPAGREQICVDDDMHRVFSDDPERDTDVFDAVCAGMRAIAERYPDYVQYNA